MCVFMCVYIKLSSLFKIRGLRGRLGTFSMVFCLHHVTLYAYLDITELDLQKKHETSDLWL